MNKDQRIGDNSEDLIQMHTFSLDGASGVEAPLAGTSGLEAQYQGNAKDNVHQNHEGRQERSSMSIFPPSPGGIFQTFKPLPFSRDSVDSFVKSRCKTYEKKGKDGDVALVVANASITKPSDEYSKGKKNYRESFLINKKTYDISHLRKVKAVDIPQHEFMKKAFIQTYFGTDADSDYILDSRGNGAMPVETDDGEENKEYKDCITNQISREGYLNTEKFRTMENEGKARNFKRKTFNEMTADIAEIKEAMLKMLSNNDIPSGSGEGYNQKGNESRYSTARITNQKHNKADIARVEGQLHDCTDEPCCVCIIETPNAPHACDPGKHKLCCSSPFRKNQSFNHKSQGVNTSARGNDITISLTSSDEDDFEPTDKKIYSKNAHLRKGKKCSIPSIEKMPGNFDSTKRSSKTENNATESAEVDDAEVSYAEVHNDHHEAEESTETVDAVEHLVQNDDRCCSWSCIGRFFLELFLQICD